VIVVVDCANVLGEEEIQRPVKCHTNLFVKTARRITIMSGPIKFRILAIVIGIKTSPICLFCDVEGSSSRLNEHFS
jgi:hypothetical protein